MKNSINLLYPIFYGCAGLLFGFLFTFWWTPNWLTLTFMIIFSIIFFVLGKKSLISVDVKYWYVRRFYGSFGEILKDGPYHLFLGFIDNKITRFMRGSFGFNIIDQVEHKIDDQDNTDYNKDALFSYQMDIDAEVTLEIGQTEEYDYFYNDDGTLNRLAVKTVGILSNHELLKNFSISTGEDKLITSILPIKEQWEKKLKGDIKSTVSLIAMHEGFAFMEANSDWNLRELLFYGMRAAINLKPSELREHGGFKPDSLVQTLKKYSLKLDSVIVKTTIEKDAKEAIKGEYLALKKRKILVVEAETREQVNKFDSRAEAFRITQTGRATTAVKAFEIEKTSKEEAAAKIRLGKAQTTAVTNSVEMLKKSGYTQQSAENQASLDNDSYQQEFKIDIGGLGGKQLGSGLLANVNTETNKNLSNELVGLFDLADTASKSFLVKWFTENIVGKDQDIQKANLEKAIKLVTNR